MPVGVGRTIKMIIDKKAIEDFRKLYQNRYGVVLSDQEVLERGTRLINLFSVILKPVPKVDFFYKLAQNESWRIWKMQ